MKLDDSQRLPDDLRSVPGWVLSVRGLSPKAWRLLIVLWSHAKKGEREPVVFPGALRRRALADDSSEDGRSQRRWLVELEDAGLVRRLTHEELTRRRQAGLVAGRDCRVLLAPSARTEDQGSPDEGPKSGHQRPVADIEGGPENGHQRPKERSPATGHQCPVTDDRQSGHQRPKKRSPATGHQCPVTDDRKSGHECPKKRSPASGHQRPVTSDRKSGHQCPKKRSPASGHQRPVTDDRRNGHQCPPKRSPVAAPIEQVQEQVQEEFNNDDNDDVVVASSNIVHLQPRRPRVELEAEVFELLLAKNIGGANPGPTFIAPIIERLEAGDVELDEVGVIADEWRRRRDAGDKAQGGFRQLFYEGKAWARTQREYLGRSLDRRDHARARARRGSKLRNTELWDEYEAGLGEGERGKT